MLDAIDGQAECPKDFAHPFGIASGQIIVDCDDVNALAFQCVQVCRQCGDQRFSFTGFHFRDATPVQNDAAYELNVEMAHVQGSLANFPHGCKCFRKNVVQGFPGGEAVAEFWSQFRQFDIGTACHLRFQVVDLLHDGIDQFEIPIVFAAKYFRDNRAEHWR